MAVILDPCSLAAFSRKALKTWVDITGLHCLILLIYYMYINHQLYHKNLIKIGKYIDFDENVKKNIGFKQGENRSMKSVKFYPLLN